MAFNSEDDTGSLERARKHLYEPGAAIRNSHTTFTERSKRSLPHTWEENDSQYKQQSTVHHNLRSEESPHRGKRHVRLASIFFTAASLFFLISIGITGYFFYYGSNVVSIDKITIDIQGPTTIAGGDTIPFLLAITNRNPVAIENATIEIDFPNGTRNATDVLSTYPRYIENLGTIASGATVTRSIKVVMFGGAGQDLVLPISFSYDTVGSNATFVKTSSYTLAISSTPLSVSVDALTETVSGKPLTFTLAVRSNATVPLNNVVLSGSFPFGFIPDSSSLPLHNSSFLLGTLLPGAVKTITLTGTLTGQDKEQRVFHFTIGVAKTAQDQTIAVTYMTQDATVTIAAPFLSTTLTLNGDTRTSVVAAPGSHQSVTISYANTLATSITNAEVAVTISGSAVDYESIRAESGFYRSVDHTVVFNRDTDPALGVLAPGAVGIGAFSFSTLPTEALASAPTIIFTTSVSGTREGQTNVPEQISASATKIVKVATTIALSAFALHTSGPLSTSGPIPPRANQETTYTIVWNVRDEGNAVAGGSVNATLPSYVSYIGTTAGTGLFSYDTKSRTVSWNTGDLVQGASAQGIFQVSITPSTSQEGSAPALTGDVSFSGHDRFAGVTVTATANPATTETSRDPGYVPMNAIVQ